MFTVDSSGCTHAPPPWPNRSALFPAFVDDLRRAYPSPTLRALPEALRREGR